MILTYIIGLLLTMGFFAALDSTSSRPQPIFVLMAAIFWPIVMPIFIGIMIGIQVTK